MYRIAEIRRGKGLQQNFVAKQVGISQQYLSELERGKRDVRGMKLKKIAEVLGCKVDDLYEQEITPTHDE